jgi:HPt (histidine-containing phosphotransfer) domain-containing protein
MKSDSAFTAYVDRDIREIIPSFFEATWDDISVVKDALSNKDYETIRRIGHGLKGSCRGYGFCELGEMGKEMERAASEKKSREKIERILEDMIRYINTVSIVYIDPPGLGKDNQK